MAARLSAPPIGKRLFTVTVRRATPTRFSTNERHVHLYAFDEGEALVRGVRRLYGSRAMFLPDSARPSGHGSIVEHKGPGECTPLSGPIVITVS